MTFRLPAMGSWPACSVCCRSEMSIMSPTFSSFCLNLFGLHKYGWCSCSCHPKLAWYAEICSHTRQVWWWSDLYTDKRAMLRLINSFLIPCAVSLFNCFIGLWKSYPFFRFRWTFFSSNENGHNEVPVSNIICVSWASSFSRRFFVNSSFTLLTYLIPYQSVPIPKSLSFNPLRFWRPLLQKKKQTSLQRKPCSAWDELNSLFSCSFLMSPLLVGGLCWVRAFPSRLSSEIFAW